MVRAISLAGLAGGFLMISPAFRGTIFNTGGSVLDALTQYAPFSYIGMGLVGVGFAMLVVYRASQPR